MHRAPRIAALLLTLVALALVAAACSSPQPTAPATGPVVTPVPTSSVAPTSTSEPEAPTVSTGPIATPAAGTALRGNIRTAVSEGLGLSGTVTVNQLFAQGTAAVGDISPASGSRMFFALTGGPKDWKLVWSAPYGSSLASVVALEKAAPLVSPELAAKLVWNKKLAKPTAAAPTLGSFEAFAAKSAKNMAGTDYTGTFTFTAKIAKDSKGVWWGNANAEPSVEGLEPIGIWGKYSGGKWTGEIADFSTEDAMAEFFPADVISKLQLP